MVSSAINSNIGECSNGIIEIKVTASSARSLMSYETISCRIHIELSYQAERIYRRFHRSGFFLVNDIGKTFVNNDESIVGFRNRELGVSVITGFTLIARRTYGTLLTHSTRLTGRALGAPWTLRIYQVIL